MRDKSWPSSIGKNPVHVINDTFNQVSVCANIPIFGIYANLFFNDLRSTLIPLAPHFLKHTTKHYVGNNEDRYCAVDHVLSKLLSDGGDNRHLGLGNV
jgi:hypothetical protein